MISIVRYRGTFDSGSAHRRLRALVHSWERMSAHAKDNRGPCESVARMTVIVGVDGSSPSRAAMGWGVRRAVHLRERLVLAHVVEDDWGQVEGESQAERDGALVLAEAVREARRMGPGLEVDERLEHGSTSVELAALAAPEDLLVVGTHKTGYIRGRVLGTRSVAVACAAQCSVVVVPDDYLASRRGVVIGITEGDEWPAAILVAATDAARHGEDLVILNAVQDDPASRRAARALLAQAAVAARESSPDLTIVSRVSGRRPAEALLNASREARMLVIGASRRSRSEIIGSVAHEVLLNINSPVMISRQVTPGHGLRSA